MWKPEFLENTAYIFALKGNEVKTFVNWRRGGFSAEAQIHGYAIEAIVSRTDHMAEGIGDSERKGNLYHSNTLPKSLDSFSFFSCKKGMKS